MTTLEARLDKIESRIEIEELVSKYAQSFDRNDRDMLRGLWFEDSVLNLGPNFGEPFKGLDGIMAAAETLWAKTPKMHHWMANSIVVIDGDTARAETALDCFVIDSDDGPTQVGGLYTDHLERRQGVWKIQLREFDLYYWAPLSDWSAAAGTDAGLAKA
ncbi:nuclear transport factor 2 family protein [Streptomyces sp. NPDC058686]|uniref:nuclear transport factor 2 family protein n=1 Tax=Streptomyces sp. NPDC058686 TaxID=3346599 RepID=UPI00365D28A1